MGILNKLVIPLPNDIASQHNSKPVNNGLFSGNDLILLLPPDGYQPSPVETPPLLFTTASSTFFAWGETTYGFSVDTPESRESPYQAIKQLIAQKRVSNELVTIHDYCEADGNVSGYATRQGLITGLARGSGSIRGSLDVTSDRYFLGGFTFSFTEVS